MQAVKSLVHECNAQLALFRGAVQNIGTASDGAAVRREVETTGRACFKACEAARNSILPQLRDAQGAEDANAQEWSRVASLLIGVVSMYLVEMRRCCALERTFPVPTEPCITANQITAMESLLENMENLITVHFATTEGAPEAKVTPRRRRGTSCRPQCMCSKLKTSYA
ncbi:rsbp-1 [Pristionchus pacificus]|uniref:Rsbp-1 n=1 Tax=Pristionchus pacificus TaxID=54126 RepID=A0A2A6CE71_PRIPA|nr:rsbp-1 [Pristionchus pacificus]|eukprot:PDM76494.1 rsbp-1 [Pristionchus pacificus]